MTNQYRDDPECRYYGSDLNKFFDLECSRNMTVNNVDCVVFKMIGNKQFLRFIESKYPNEKYGQNQEKWLLLLAQLCSLGNRLARKTSFEVFAITGEPPYENGEVLIYNYITNESVTLTNKQQLIDFLSFKTKFFDIKKG